MNGVTTEATLAIRRTPPRITRASRTARTMPEVRVDTGKAFRTAVETPLAWTVGRKKPQATTVMRAKTMPSQRWFMPCSMKLNGPPRKPEWCGNL